MPVNSTTSTYSLKDKLQKFVTQEEKENPNFPVSIKEVLILNVES